ncbi:hypothetical protein LQV05_004837 [Cryptococcus neoformans]|nr:amidohydrolase family protein [Cryptococcus neoformans var. grubii]OXC60761.1 amidohydrolase family protein [Cryptococcus neoformans var. grubii MW-RSA852]UOH82144.1 hypothetical protein LQV05_004837 [Cryptococcus neoformans]
MPTRLRHDHQPQPTINGIMQYPRHPPPRVPSTRSLHLSISLLIVAAVIVYAQKQSFMKNVLPSKVYSVTETLPEKYAICGKEGNKVYTVPYEVETAIEVAGAAEWEKEAVGAVQCVVVDNDKVVDTGSLNKIRRKWVKNTLGRTTQDDLQVIHLPPGHTLTPGFTDSHGHPLVYGHAQQLPLHGCKSIEEVIAKVEDYVNHHPLEEGQWIEGLGWDQNLWKDKVFPTAEEFDKSDLLTGLPISLARVDYHVEWVSTAVLRLMDGIPDVEGGTVMRDSQGEPTGIFIDNAISLLTAIRPAWTDIDRERFLDIVVRDALSHGLTGAYDAMGLVSDQPFWRRMAEEGKLPIRFYSMLSCENEEDFCGDKVEPYHNFEKHYYMRGVKLFGDGALGSRGAALIDDYSDQPGWKGLMLKKEEAWGPLIKQWYEAGWQICVHTIGDRAAKVVLDAISSVTDLPGIRKARFRLEHAQIMTLEDLERAAKMGIIASVQPTHATSDMWYAEDRLGTERIRGAYVWRSYLNNSGHITLGSDFPVESLDPLKGFYAAVTRRSPEGKSPHGKGGWYPEQRLSRVEALRGFTVWGAYASFSEDLVGSLTPGKKFDAVIWDDDLLTVPEDEMLDVKVKGVIVDGKLVWGTLG